MQACGLKLLNFYNSILLDLSRLMQACGLKQKIAVQTLAQPMVTPHAGVWIETYALRLVSSTALSRLMQACGLKHQLKIQHHFYIVRHASCRRVD